MEVILAEDYPSLGYVGDKVNVKKGFARNYLIPRGIALESGSVKARVLAHLVQGINAKKNKKKKEAEELSSKLATIQLDFTLKAVQGGKSFGSITSKEIEAALSDKGYKIDRKLIKILEPLKSSGNHKVPVKLHSEVTAYVSTEIVVERPVVKAESKETKRGRGRSAKSEVSADESVVSAEGTEEAVAPKKRSSRKSAKATDVAPEQE